MAINDVLSVRAARLDAVANLKCFWSSGLPIFDGFVYIYYAVPPYSARIIYSCLANSVCPVQRLVYSEAERRIYAGWVKSPVLF